MATNEEWVYPVTQQERRAFILDVRKHPFQTREYFEALLHEWKHGGREAFLAFLLARTGVLVPLPQPPRTLALAEQMHLTNDEVTSWWEEKLSDGEVEPGKGWPDWVACVTLYYDYLDHCSSLRNRGANHTQRSFMNALKRLWPMTGMTMLARRITCPRRYKSPEAVTAVKKGWTLPSVEKCREAFDERCGVETAWEATTRQAAMPLLEAKDDPDDDDL
jgi:hypothetical protein